MMQFPTNDLDYLAARLHGRRSRMAEGNRLDALCHAKNIGELGRLFFADSAIETARDFQRRALAQVIQEFLFCLRFLAGPRAGLVEWMKVRFEIENYKVLLRGFVNHLPVETIQKHLASVPGGIVLDPVNFLTSKSLEEFAKKIPHDPVRKPLLRLALANEQRVFFLEAALDAGYFFELLERLNRLRDEERKLMEPLILQEIETFYLMLIVRGKFMHQLSFEELSWIQIGGDGLARVRKWFSSTDIPMAGMLARGHVIDDAPAAVDASMLETLAWQRFYRLSNRLFRNGWSEYGLVIGYLALRRIELANVIRISEGVRTGIGSHDMRANLIPGAIGEAAHV